MDDYAVHRLRKMLCVAFKEVEAVDWNWPGTTEEVSDFLKRGRCVFQKVRAAGDLLGGSGLGYQERQAPGYLTLSFVRNALVAQIAAGLPGPAPRHGHVHHGQGGRRSILISSVGVVSTFAALSRSCSHLYIAVFRVISSLFFVFSAWHLTSIQYLTTGIPPLFHHN